MKTVRRAALLAVALAIALPARGYQVDEDGAGHPLHWPEMPVAYRLVSGNAPLGTLGEQAVQRAFETWSDASANVSYVFEGYDASGRDAYDGENLVYWVHSGWAFDENAVAVTARYSSRHDGRLLDADILFNGELYAWSVVGSGYDIENVAAHEVGHLSGLGHSTVPGATMNAGTYPGETKKRSLTDDDRTGLDAIYGGVGESPGSGIEGTDLGSPRTTGSDTTRVESGPSGGCAIGRKPAADGSDPFWVAPLLVAIAVRRRSRAGAATAARSLTPGAELPP